MTEVCEGSIPVFVLCFAFVVASEEKSSNYQSAIEPTAMATHCVRRLLGAFFLLSSVMIPTQGCTTVLTAAKAAYDSQIDFMRRGLTAETTVSLYAEFIANLAAKAWETGPVGSAFGDVCLSDSYLAQLQDENGTLLGAAAVDNDIADSGAKVSLMTKEELAGLTYPLDAADSEWALTSAYLMEDIPLVINISRLVFPDEGSIRVDSYQSDACYQFEQRYSTSGLSTVSAANWTANVLSLVLKLIDMGANATKAIQLLKHATAYTSVGARCHGLQKSELQVPMVFLTAYARQSAWLSQNNSAVLSTEVASTKLLYANPEILNLLTSFSSGGELPTTIITANGHLHNMSFDWTSSTDALNTFLVLRESMPLADVYYKRVESSVNAAISAVIANKNDLAFSISRKMEGPKPYKLISVLGSRFDDLTRGINALTFATRRFLSVPDQELEPNSSDLRTVIRQQCGSGWVFVTRSVPNWTEQCCATICITGAEGLSSQDSILFTEECCNACNEFSCSGGDQAAAEGAAELVGIELPPIGSNGNESVPVMI